MAYQNKKMNEQLGSVRQALIETLNSRAECMSLADAMRIGSKILRMLRTTEGIRKEIDRLDYNLPSTYNYSADLEQRAKIRAQLLSDNS